MTLDHATLEAMRRQHPAWRLLAADSAPLVASFLHRVFVVPNVRTMGQADLAEALEDSLFALREQRGAEAYPKAALDYLNDWAANDKGWLRKFYPPGSDEPHFDLTPATEKATRAAAPRGCATLASRSTGPNAMRGVRERVDERGRSARSGAAAVGQGALAGLHGRWRRHVPLATGPEVAVVQRTV